MLGRVKQSILPVLSLFLIISCASTRTSQGQYIEAEAMVSQGNYLAAAQIIEEAHGKEYKEKEKVLYYLDLGMLYHYAGEYEKSNQALSEAEFGIEDLYTNSISKSISTGLLNDNAQDYKGEIYEDLYINIFKGLNYVALGDNEGALVEIRRVNIKLGMLQDKYDALYGQYVDLDEASKADVEKIQNEFHNNALARYLGCVLYRALGDYDDARIDRDFFSSSYLSQPTLYPFDMALPPDARPARGEGIPVNFFAFAGQSPGKVGITYYIDSMDNTLFFTTVDQDEDDYLKELADMDAMFVPGLDYGFHMKLQFPKMFDRGLPISQIRVLANDQVIANLGLTEDIQHVAQTTFVKGLPLIVGKTVTRAIIKGVVKEGGQAATNAIVDDQIGGLEGALLKFALGVATDVAVDATENADLRVSNFFPAQAYTGEIYLEPGVYDLKVEYYNGNNLLFSDHLGEREISKDKSIIESFYLL